MFINSYLEYKEFHAYYGESFPIPYNYDLVEVFNRECPYCGATLKLYHNFHRYDTNVNNNQPVVQQETIMSCPNDGWWQHKIYERQDVDPKNWYAVIHEGILKSYDLESLTIPIQVLRNYICNNPDKIIDIHHKKMEELVASVFKDFYACEAHVVGKSSDGGVDIVLIDGDNPIMIQVKRRKSLQFTESVSEVRELLGATLLREAKGCIFVSTANKFSQIAEKTASRSIELGLVKKYDLIDYGKFISMLKNQHQKVNETWDELLILSRLNGSHYGLAYI